MPLGHALPATPTPAVSALSPRTHPPAGRLGDRRWTGGWHVHLLTSPPHSALGCPGSRPASAEPSPRDPRRRLRIRRFQCLFHAAACGTKETRPTQTCALTTSMPTSTRPAPGPREPSWHRPHPRPGPGRPLSCSRSQPRAQGMLTLASGPRPVLSHLGTPRERLLRGAGNSGGFGVQGHHLPPAEGW